MEETKVKTAGETTQDKTQNADNKAHRGKPRRGGRGGNRDGATRGRGFGRGGKKFDNKRDQEETKGDNKGKRDNKNKKRRGHAPSEAPKDSFFYKFHFGPWPELSEVEVTLETELPEQIPRDERLKEPTKDEYVKGMQNLDEEIKTLIEKIKKTRAEKEEVYQRGREESKAKAEAEGTKNEGKSFRELVDEKKALFEKKKALDEKSKKEKTICNQAQNDLKALQKNVNPKLKTAKAVNSRVKDIEKTIQTSTISAKQEKEYYKEISFLKKSLKYVEKLEKIPDTKKNWEAAKAFDKESRKYRTEIAKINNLLDTMNEEFQKRKEMSEDKKVELKAFDEKMDKIREGIKAVEVRKDEAREEYYKKKYEFEVQKASVIHVDRIHKKKAYLLKIEEDKKKEEEAKRAERDAMPNPFEDDISTCDFLIRYCKKLIRDREQKETKVAKDSETKEELAKKAEEFKKQADEGKIMFIKTKEEREKDEVTVIGGRAGGKKKNKRRNKKQPKKEEAREARDPNELNFKYELIQNFGEVGVNSPAQFDELVAKIEELEAKRNEFFEKGEKKLDQDFLKSTPEDGAKDSQEETSGGDKKKAFNLEEEDEANWPTMQ